MKNRNIIFITVLFSLMLVGIILVQAWWIRFSIHLQEKAFDAAAYRVLEEVVRQTAEKENFSFIKQEYANDTVIRATHKTRHVASINGRNNHSSAVNVIKINTGDDSGGQSKTIIQIEKDDDDGKTIEHRVIIGSGEKVTIPEPPVPPTPPDVPEEKIEAIEVLVKKMTHLKNPDSLTVKPADIQRIIAAQIKQNNLPELFAFAMLNKKGSVIYQNNLFKDTSLAYKINLYPNDLFGRSTRLFVMFPEKSVYIKGNIWWVFALSLVFTIAMLVLFAYSIRMLLKHKKLLEVKNDFINHMSHELKTPLATISLGADILLDGTSRIDESQVQKIAQSIKKQSMRLHEDMKQILLNALLDNYQAKNEVFDLTEVCKRSLLEMQFLLENKNAIIKTHFDTMPVIVKGDKDLWHKVFTNLIDNALKFSKDVPEINITISKSNQSTKIVVSDKGIGIAEKDTQHIFEKFYRADYYKKSAIQGFGLGLNFVQKVVKLHHGTISVNSSLGAGTTFRIELPNE